MTAGPIRTCPSRQNRIASGRQGRCAQDEMGRNAVVRPGNERKVPRNAGGVLGQVDESRQRGRADHRDRAMHGGGDRDAPFVRGLVEDGCRRQDGGHLAEGGGEGTIRLGLAPVFEEQDIDGERTGVGRGDRFDQPRHRRARDGKASFPADDFVVDGDDRDIFGRRAWTGHAHAQVRRRRLQVIEGRCPSGDVQVREPAAPPQRGHEHEEGEASLGPPGARDRLKPRHRTRGSHRPKRSSRLLTRSCGHRRTSRGA